MRTIFLASLFLFVTSAVMAGEILLLASSLPGAAQCCGARITGKVSDAEGAAIPNAKVTIINAATGHSFKAITNQMGEFQAPPLPLGTYKAKVSCKGFETTETPARTLAIDQVLRFDVTLRVKAKAKKK